MKYIVAAGALCVLGYTAALPNQAIAAELEVEVPRLQVAAYHRPYVAIWVSDPRQQRVADVAVWYDVAMADAEGEKWLPDMRQWWRRSGRSLSMPVDGVSGATRPVGKHRVALPDNLSAGDYIVHVEAARELGGREHIQIPFSVSADGSIQSQQQHAQGSSELGHVALIVNQ
ncbi:MAG: DUF2271 domain-containing protein [Firmicutes bacterium]|nr:DUF2271 domain-containing protein [Bacillota bacterium]